jgi:hypothetical protein
MRSPPPRSLAAQLLLALPRKLVLLRASGLASSPCLASLIPCQRQQTLALPLAGGVLLPLPQARGAACPAGARCLASGETAMDGGQDGCLFSVDGRAASSRQAPAEVSLGDALLAELVDANMGRQFRTLKTALARLPKDGCEAEREELMTQRAAFEAAKALHMTKIPTADRMEVIKNVQCLALHEVQLPCLHRTAITNKEAMQMLSSNQVQPWAQTIWPFAWDDVTGHAWQPEKPLFARCLPEAESPDSDKQAFAQLWHGAIFCDAFVRRLNEASELPGNNTKPLEEACLALLQRAGPMDEIPEHLQAMVSAATSCLRGLLALCSPIPGLCGSCLGDVRMVAPGEGDGQLKLAALLPKVQ